MEMNCLLDFENDMCYLARSLLNPVSAISDHLAISADIAAVGAILSQEACASANSGFVDPSQAITPGSFHLM
ncbi:hypothetical protein Ancab_031446 [Ancistrocladus abbreviatus]